jgi:hypothetical protein
MFDVFGLTKCQLRLDAELDVNERIVSGQASTATRCSRRRCGYRFDRDVPLRHAIDIFAHDVNESIRAIVLEVVHTSFHFKGPAHIESWCAGNDGVRMS